MTATAFLHRRRSKKSARAVPANHAAGPPEYMPPRDGTFQATRPSLQGPTDPVPGNPAASSRSANPVHRLAPGDPERDALRETVIAEYMPYARHLAARYGVPAQAVEDFQQVAYLGLVKAVDSFDPHRGTGFLTYATPTILGEIKRHFRDCTWAVHVPRPIQEISSELRSATETLTGRLHRSPTVAELAELLGTGIDQIADAIDAVGLHSVASLDVPACTEDGSDSALGDLIGDEDPAIQNITDREMLRPLIARLSARDKQILLMRFFRGMTQSQIGAELGVSQMQVSRLLSGIFGRLRQGLEDPPPTVPGRMPGLPQQRRPRQGLRTRNS